MFRIQQYALGSFWQKYVFDREKLNPDQDRTKGNLCLRHDEIGALETLTTGQHSRRTLAGSIARIFGVLWAMGHQTNRVLGPSHEAQ